MTRVDPLPTAIVQFAPRLGERDANLARMCDFATRAADAGAGLVVLPECSLQGIVFDSREAALEVAEPADGPAAAELSAGASDLGIAIVYGFLERLADGFANAVHFLLPDGSRHLYRKTHLTELGADRWATPGECLGDVVEYAGVRLATLICYDVRFPEASRVLALRGADAILLPTNSPVGYEGTYDHAARTRAWENRAWFLAVNRVGVEAGTPFIGRSIVADPLGREVVQLGGEEETLAVVELDASLARSKLLPGHDGEQYDFLSARRPDLYGPLAAGA